MHYSIKEKERLLRNYLLESQAKSIRFSRLEVGSFADKMYKYNKSISNEDLSSMQWRPLFAKPYLHTNTSPEASKGIIIANAAERKMIASQKNAVQRRMRRVANWVQDCQRYNGSVKEKGSTSRKRQNEPDRFRFIINCPSWMKTAGQMRHSRVKRNDGSSEESANAGLDEETSQSQSVSEEGPSEQDGASYDSSRLGTMSIQTIEDNGVNLVNIFQEVNENEQYVFITCCFQHENKRIPCSKKSIGFLTCKKISF